MATLWAVTLLWAFSFSLIGEFLAGQVDGYFAVLTRMLLALLLLLPFYRPNRFPARIQLKLAIIGAVQIGFMYLFFYHSFLYLSVPEVLLFTVFTPLYITLCERFIYRRSGLPPGWWWATLLAVVGALVIRYDNLSQDFWLGFLLIQAANICFALGQVAYKHLPLGSQRNQLHAFALFFIGASIVAAAAFLLFGNLSKLPQTNGQWAVLGWLGLVASGLGYIAWNSATKRVNTAQLATMNNMLIPAGLLVNVLIWQQSTDWLRLIIGALLLLGALQLAHRSRA
ncbi:EamA family transporter [Pseudidiomarina taiwanensis]|uniref:EamA family transporter n=1 Tax=Pseudidiomarina taiwanensis TaxID=337250 RepID=A0A432ZNP4_9GAMM|nr:EamA family transporter [Pseudidiomarina taiwanensis]RUO79514.1 EamA family transporter [Pseudidiomarina taiwanensis]